MQSGIKKLAGGRFLESNQSP